MSDWASAESDLVSATRANACCASAGRLAASSASQAFSCSTAVFEGASLGAVAAPPAPPEPLLDAAELPAPLLDATELAPPFDAPAPSPDAPAFPPPAATADAPAPPLRPAEDGRT